MVAQGCTTALRRGDSSRERPQEGATMPTDPVLARRFAPESPTERFSRRQMLRVSAGGTAALAFAGNRIKSSSGQGYQGELVIVSVQQVEQAAPTIAAIEA